MELPRGYRLSAVACGLKRDPATLDLAVILSDRPAMAAGVYTTNQVVAAPVQLDRQRTPSADVRAVVVNSGNANACTGRQGWTDAVRMASCVAESCGCLPEQVLVMSTGIIGHPLDMRKIEPGIARAVSTLAASRDAVSAVARAFMTTDTVPKMAHRSVLSGGQTWQFLGFAKGAGMIAPQMATMLGLVLTDAPLESGWGQTLLQEVANDTFNAISVDGHMSTNDSLLLLANGAASAGGPTTEDRQAIRTALEVVCQELALAIVRDGEGATHCIEIRVTGLESNVQARQVAREIANSPLVKTAVAGADPNWGRIVSAAGYAGVPLDLACTTLRLNGSLLFAAGEPVGFDANEVSRGMRASAEVCLELCCGSGPGKARFWTCDLTAEYVRINADYHT